MHRRSMRSAVVLVAVATLTLAACGSKSTETTSSSAAPAASGSGGFRQCGRSGGASAGGALAIKAELQIDKDGKEVAGRLRRNPGQPGR